MRLWCDLLHGDLAPHINMDQFRRAASAHIDKCATQFAAFYGGRCQGHGCLEHNVVTAGAEGRVAFHAQFPGQGQPEALVFRHLKFLQLYAGNAGLTILCQHPLDRLAGRGKAGDAAPQLSAADLPLCAALL